MIRNTAAWQILMGLFVSLMGVFGGCQFLEHGWAEEEEVSSGPAATRRLREYGTGEETPEAYDPVSALTLLMLGVFGVGTTLHGVRRLRREGHLLVEGIPVVGRLTHVTPLHRRERGQILTYCYEDDAGRVHHGSHEVSSAEMFLDGYEVGQEVTVIYDPANPYNHMLDVENVRRADAALRNI